MLEPSHQPSAKQAAKTSQPQSALGKKLLASSPLELSLELNKAAIDIGLPNLTAIGQRGRYRQRLLQAMGSAQLVQEIQQLSSGNSADQRLAKQLVAAKQALAEASAQLVERQFNLAGKPHHQQLRTARLMDQPMIDLQDQPLARQLVRQMARRLISSHHQRRRKPQPGQLDVGKTLHRNMAYGGVILKLEWRNQRPDRPRLWVVCDVSQSVRSHALFLLLLVYSLKEVLPKVRAFAFSSDMQNISNWLEQQTAEQAIQQVLAEVGRGSTDYGTALEQFCDAQLTALNRQSTVLILGDSRNNHGDPKFHLLRAIHQRAGQVIWLNPETKQRWGQGDSEMPGYQPYCASVHSCNTLAQLQRVISQLLTPKH